MNTPRPGTCFAMCSDKERWLREREGLLHILEIDQCTKGSRRPKADPTKTVKCYSRSGAGKNMTDPSELRPAPVLLMTLKYLTNNVTTRLDVNWASIYEFVSDRMRAIRQDMIIQRIAGPIGIRLFEPMVKFHIYARERMCETSPEEFVPKFNDQHCLECIKQLLALYDERDATAEERGIERLSVSDNRAGTEALYILMYLGDDAALRRALSLPLTYRASEQVATAIEISLAWRMKNYVRVCRSIRKLAPLFACAALGNLPLVKRNALRIMSHAYNSPSLTYPGLKLQETLLYTDIGKIEKDCQLFGLSFVRENVLFQKSTFNENVPLANVEKHFKEETLRKLLPEILLE